MGSLGVSAVASVAAGVQGQSEAAVLGQAWLLVLEWMVLGLQELGPEQLAWVQPA
jgi:hypothetical protein